MDIPELSMSLARANTMNDVGIAVLGKVLDNAENSGDGLINMMNNSMELSVNPNLGANIDLRI